MTAEDSAVRDGGADSRSARVTEVVADVARRRSEGELVLDEEIAAAHPELMPELGQQLAALRLVEQARQRAAANDDVTQTLSPEDTTEGHGDTSATLPTHPGSIAGYTIIRELHRGGQGVVYQAIQQSTRRKVAIKVMKEGPFGGAADRARFDREVTILGQLKHPNIVTVHDSGEAAGSHYFVMDYVSGRALDEHIERNKPSIDETLELFGKICEAVNAAHLRGVIHRDLKPGNIRVDANGQPHVLDFGLARSGSETGASLMTLTGQFVGSLPWASPEQAEGVPGNIDIRTDVYSLGVILYQMLTGRFPYEVAGNMRDVLDNILQAEPARPSTIRRQINDEVETIVLKCLSKAPERRYQSAGELGRDVRHYLAGEPIEAKRDSGWYVLRKNLQRYRVAVAVAASFLVVVLAALVISTIYWRQAVHERERAEAALLSEQKQRELAEAATSAAESERKKAETINKFVTEALVTCNPYYGGHGGFLVADAMNQAVELLDAGQLKDQPETEVALRLTISLILSGNARDEEALRVAERALKISQQLHDGDHPTVARAMMEVGRCLTRLGRYAKSLATYEAALEMRKRLDQGDSPGVAWGMLLAADCLSYLGRPAEALPKQRKALEIFQRDYNGDHRSVAHALMSVAGSLQHLGRPAEALPNLEAALEINRRLYEGDHSEIARSLNYVGVCLQQLGRSAEALPMNEAALAMNQRLFEGDNGDVAESLVNLASCLHSLGRSAEALPKFEAAVEMFQRLYPDSHPGTAQLLTCFANCLVSLDRSEEALPKYQAALEIRQRALPSNHPKVVQSLSDVAYCLHSLGRSAEALRMYEAALEIEQRLYQGDHPDVAASLHNVAHCLEALGRSAEALPKYEAALAMTQRLHPRDHPAVETSLNNVALCLESLGQHAEAEPFYRQALDAQRSAQPSSAPSVAYALAMLGWNLIQQQRYQEAEPLLRECLDIREKVMSDHWLRFNTMSMLGESVAGQGRLPEAEPMLLEGYRGMKDDSAASDARKRAALYRIVKLYDGWHTSEQDGGYDAKAAEWRAKLEEWQATTHPTTTESRPATTQPTSEPAASPANGDE